MDTLQAYITWSPDPEIFRIGGVAVRWYGLLFALSFVFGYIIMLRFFRKEGIPDRVLDTLTTYMVIGTVVGARLGHCFFYEPDYYLANPVRILYVWEGGLASHGAAIGIILVLIIFSRTQKKPFLWIMDRIVIVVALSGFFIRMGNLANSEIFGIPTTLPWGFLFQRASDPAEALLPRHPTQIYEGSVVPADLRIPPVVLLQERRKTGSGIPVRHFPDPGFRHAVPDRIPESAAGQL